MATVKPLRGSIDVTNTQLSLGNPYISNSSSNIISFNSGIDLSINIPSESYIIRSDSNGKLLSADLVNYIQDVNDGKTQSIIKYDGTDYGTSSSGTPLTTGYTDTSTYTNITSTSIYNHINSNSVKWYTDKGVINTIIGADGTIRFDKDHERNMKRMRLKSGLTIITKSRSDFIPKDIPENERIAIDTLREEISEKEFRRYIKHGFVLVQGASGDTYQIFRNRSHTKVWRGGKVVEEICVRIKDWNIPPTDNVIAFKNIIQFSEEEFKKLGNVYRMRVA
jgi:hypothetical protein